MFVCVCTRVRLCVLCSKTSWVRFGYFRAAALSSLRTPDPQRWKIKGSGPRNILEVTKDIITFLSSKKFFKRASFSVKVPPALLKLEFTNLRPAEHTTHTMMPQVENMMAAKGRKPWQGKSQRGESQWRKGVGGGKMGKRSQIYGDAWKLDFWWWALNRLYGYQIMLHA